MARRRLDKVAVWNMKVGRGRAALHGLRALIRDTDADAVLLQEAKNYLPAIRLLFGARWRVYGRPAFRDAGNCVGMVRRTVRRGKRGRVRNRKPWHYRGKGRHVAHEGRVWPWFWADGVGLMPIHRATEALGYNDDAGAEEADNLLEWFGDHHGPMFAGGDWNNLASDRRANSPADIARHARAQIVVPAGARIDFALVRDIDAAAERLDRYGSDHHAHVYKLRRP